MSSPPPLFPPAKHIPVTRAQQASRKSQRPCSGGFDSFGNRGTVAVTPPAFHMAGGTREDMHAQEKRSHGVSIGPLSCGVLIRHVVAKNTKPFAPSEVRQNRNASTQITDLLDSAVMMQAMGHGVPLSSNATEA